jgi:hypothetical protein
MRHNLLSTALDYNIFFLQDSFSKAIKQKKTSPGARLNFILNSQFSNSNFSHTCPSASMASATLTKPAMLAPFT